MTDKVDAAWEALVEGLDAVNSRSFGMRFIVDAHRPRIEAAIRAESEATVAVPFLLLQSLMSFALAGPTNDASRESRDRIVEQARALAATPEAER